MNRYVAFLRGMNLGRRRIKNPELCAAFEGIGFTNVSAFLASGNVIFDTDESDSAAVADSLNTDYEIRWATKSQHSCEARTRFARSLATNLSQTSQPNGPARCK